MKKPRSIISSLILLFLAINAGQGLQGQTFHPDYLDGNIYLKLQDTTTVNLEPYGNNILPLNLILATFGVDSLYRPFKSGHPALQNVYRMEFSDTMGADNLIAQLGLLSFVEYAEKVPLVRTTGDVAMVPNDLQISQWGLAKIQAPFAWDVTIGNPSIKVAIVDNAVRLTHEDLASAIWTNPGETANNFLDDDLNGYVDDVRGYDVADFDANVNPPAGVSGWDHGTHCAGIAGATTNNGLGIASIGFGISIIPVKASNNSAGGNTLAKAYEGVDYARAAGADVISMSWGSRGISATGNLVLSLASNAGILLVAAAGNNNDSIPFYPAANTLCIAVGSTDQADLRSPFSNYGAYIDVMAPGSDIYSCLAGSDSDYGTLSGTSMACPLVAGLAGLIWSFSPSLTAVQVRTAIVNGCDNIDALNPIYAGDLGAGRINAYRSFNATGSATAFSPQPMILLSPNPASAKVKVHFPEDWKGPGIFASVYDMRGVQIEALTLQPAEAVISCENWTSGIYFLKFQQGARFHTVKLQVR